MREFFKCFSGYYLAFKKYLDLKIFFICFKQEHIDWYWVSHAWKDLTLGRKSEAFPALLTQLACA